MVRVKDNTLNEKKLYFFSLIAHKIKYAFKNERCIREVFLYIHFKQKKQEENIQIFITLIIQNLVIPKIKQSNTQILYSAM